MIPPEDNEDPYETSSASSVTHQPSNCSKEESRAMKDGNDAVLRQFEVKKLQMEFSKTQVGYGSKSLSSLNMTTANVDWSGFSAAAHDYIGNTSNSKSPRRHSLQSQSLVTEKNEQNGTDNSKKIEKLKISRRRLLQVANKDGSTTTPPPSSELLPNQSAYSEQCKSRRSTSRRNLVADVSLYSSGNRTDQKFRRRRSSARNESKEIPTPRLQQILNPEISYSSTDCNTTMVTTPAHTPISPKGSGSIAIGCSRGIAASSTTLGVGRRKSLSKTKSRKSLENLLGSELKKQSSIKW
mmetsp:Transcript_4374/g.12562  ORF Transcript_4374/g.12562 Transcript_4374/m.12562 type:complete len:296 (-) Transcript_4374:561-1448(-)|eukprot:CAMPEP_0172360940 /NCGR_PEP_ID=MMETSP1060-20121228/4859_1 /TAXON_ID=37318 /ORGANISM="Pseudo-nitzschia pungens, Strain cf. cingulata" /LENGTH=295 /DNA_ID=CAMNT_0013083055 /DNA_START=165 /DNA_END=1052 /DNA_ORIENTATION=-